MTSRADLWHTAAALAREGRTAAFATVCRRRGSLPMASDAKMLIAGEGETWGTVGGGCVESDVTHQALDAAAAGAPTVVSHTLNADLAGDVGLSCGGTVEFFLEPIVHTEVMAHLYDAVADAVERRVPVRVVTARQWRDGPSKTAILGGHIVSVGHRISDVERPITEPGASFLDDECFAESISRLPRVIVFGAGHVGREIAKLAAGAGFYLVVADDRAEFANATRFPWAQEVYAEALGGVLERLALDADDYVVAATRGHQHDAEVIGATAASPARYVGMLGSRRKREVVFAALRESGVPAEAVERVRVPIGEPIGAETPEEIAVSVVAELIRVRRGG